MTDIIYFELNNWFAGDDYPAAEPFLSWMGNDCQLRFIDDAWVRENKLCVVANHVDMSVNFCITATKGWVEQNCPELLTKYTEFVREYDPEYEEVYGRFGTCFLEYEEDNFGVHWNETEPLWVDCDEEGSDE